MLWDAHKNKIKGFSHLTEEKAFFPPEISYIFNGHIHPKKYILGNFFPTKFDFAVFFFIEPIFLHSPDLPPGSASPSLLVRLAGRLPSTR